MRKTHLKKNNHPLRPRPLLAIAAVCLLSIIPLSAIADDCSDLPGNLLTNCGFNTDISSWVALFGPGSHDPIEGYLAPGAALLSGGDTGNGEEFIFRQCVSPVQPSVTYTFSGAVRGQAPLPDSCRLFIGTRSELNCSGGGTFVETVMTPQVDTWLVFPDNEITTTASTVAVQFQFRCVRAGEETFTVHFDDAYFGVPPLVQDGFEDMVAE